MKITQNIYKPIGATPLDVILSLKNSSKEFSDITMGYAGRLDPMADGVLLVLLGEENLKRKEYELLPKEYRFEVLFGFETDTYDIMGIAQKIDQDNLEITSDLITNCLKKYVGTWEQEYPPYSSIRINGKPLFYWAREKKLEGLLIPKKKITITSCELIDMTTITSGYLLDYISERVSKARGDFRQEEIITRWKQLLQYKRMYTKITCHIQCSSGTYVRSIANDLGQKLSLGGVAFSITRTAIGSFNIDDSIRLT